MAAASSKPRPHPPRPVTLEDLRPLLVGPEQGRIQRIEERLDRDFGEMVAGVLPEAVAESRKKGDALILALDPVVDQCVRRAMSKDPGGFAEVIAPALGSAIRKAVSNALRAALQKLNVALERSLSTESLRWRVEAWRTGRSFAEVVLLRTLVYRVEEVFLIHRDTGLLLAHQRADDLLAQDADQVAAMMSALETFTREAFREDARLERFRVGDLTGWVEHGPNALLAAVVRGTAPESYEGVLREAIERIHLEDGKHLIEFHGDIAPFARAEEDALSSCLVEHHELPRRAQWLSQRAAVASLAVIVATVLGLVVYQSWRQQRLFAAYLGALKSEPGLVVMEAEWHGGGGAFTGLSDPLAPDPATVLARSGLDPTRVSLHFAPFQSLDPSMIERRAKQVLHPPEGVSLAYADGVLGARGVAPKAWIEHARGVATLLPGITAFDDWRLVDRESLDRAEASAAARGIERMEVYFLPGSVEPVADARATLDALASAAKELFALAREAGMTARIEVIGYVDASGPRALDDGLSLARAQRVATEILGRAHGVPEGSISARAGGVRSDVPASAEDAWRARCVMFRVHVRGPAEEQSPTR